MKYEVTLFMNKYMKIGEEWQDVDVKRTFTFNSKDKASALVDSLVEGAKGAVKFEIEAKEEAQA